MKSPVHIARLLIRHRLQPFPLPETPELDPEALTEFERRLRRARLYLEFGCGGSTVTASRLRIPTVSVESDRHFARRMARALGPSSSARIMHADIGLTHNWGRPVFSNPTPRRIAKWSRYSAAPWSSLPAGSFPDFILIDGRFRRACALEVARRVAGTALQTTILFDDFFNHGREAYRSVEQHLGEPGRIGRAALFELDGNRQYPRPSDAELAEANSDPD